MRTVHSHTASVPTLTGVVHERGSPRPMKRLTGRAFGTHDDTTTRRHDEILVVACLRSFDNGVSEQQRRRRGKGEKRFSLLLPYYSPTPLLLLILAACGGQPTQHRVADPIAGIPENQQRTVGRNDFPRRWPFTVGTGTLGCVDGAVVFHVSDITYALNDAAASRGFGSAEPIRLTQHRAPSNPLSRLTQERRMQIFTASGGCADSVSCKQRLREVHAISGAELQQIEAEGLERNWPPLPPKHVPLDPLLAAGRQLCPPV